MNPTERLLNLIALFLAAPAPVSLAELRRLFYPGTSRGDMSARRLFTRDKAWLSQLGFPLVHHRLARDGEASDAAEGYRLSSPISLDPMDLPPRQRRHLLECAFNAMVHPALKADAAVLHAAWVKLSLAESDGLAPAPSPGAHGRVVPPGQAKPAPGNATTSPDLGKKEGTRRAGRPFARLPPMGFAESSARGWTGEAGARAKRFRQIRSSAVRGEPLLLTFRPQGGGEGCATMTGIVQDAFLDGGKRLWLRIGSIGPGQETVLLEPGRILEARKPERSARSAITAGPSHRRDASRPTSSGAANEDMETTDAEGPRSPATSRFPSAEAASAGLSGKRGPSSVTWLSWQAILQGAGPRRLGRSLAGFPALSGSVEGVIASVGREIAQRAREALAACPEPLRPAEGGRRSRPSGDTTWKRKSAGSPSPARAPGRAHGAGRRADDAAANDP